MELDNYSFVRGHRGGWKCRTENTGFDVSVCGTVVMDLEYSTKGHGLKNRALINSQVNLLIKSDTMHVNEC